MSGENIGSSSFKVLDCEGQTNSEEHNQLEGRPCGMPPTSQLPGFRFSGEFAFTSVGVDFAGPVYVKDFYHKSTDMNKAYIVLYTCGSSRAVHLDLIPRLSTEGVLEWF